MLHYLYLWWQQRYRPGLILHRIETRVNLLWLWDRFQRNEIAPLVNLTHCPFDLQASESCPRWMQYFYRTRVADTVVVLFSVVNCYQVNISSEVLSVTVINIDADFDCKKTWTHRKQIFTIWNLACYNWKLKETLSKHNSIQHYTINRIIYQIMMMLLIMIGIITT